MQTCLYVLHSYSSPLYSQPRCNWWYLLYTCFRILIHDRRASICNAFWLFRYKKIRAKFPSSYDSNLFYSTIIFALSRFVFHETVSTSQILKLFRPATQSGYWFIDTYVLLFLIAPYINRLLQSISKREFLSLLITLTIMVCYFGKIANNQYCDLRSLLMFCYLYSLGYFIRNYYPDGIKFPIVGNKPLLLYGISCLILFILISFLPGPLSSVINSLFSDWDRIGKLILVVLFFLSFQNMKFQSNLINILAKSSFAIYLIHGHYIVTYNRWIYDLYSEYAMPIGNIHLKLLFLLVCAILICIICILLDQIRILIFRLLIVDNFINWVDTKTNNIVNKLRCNTI